MGLEWNKNLLFSYFCFSQEFDVVAKPHVKEDPSKETDLWRVAYSAQEQELLRSFDKDQEMRCEKESVVVYFPAL